MSNLPGQAEAAEWLTPGVAAHVLGVTPKTVAKLADEGRISFIRPGKHRRYLRSDVERLLREAAA